MLRDKPQAAAVIGLVLVGLVAGLITAMLDVPKPWTYVVLAVVAAVAAVFMVRRFHR
ncbi:hypothetical protein [Lentzea cavernae]|uniref:PEP-CTERM protein-sorting domain-containing protein n=1 Tax=Lentzea cavernae TaxID=2020703 RepID=A0ABQ3MDC5_9PSEU|nr:hypothetical protein [Lentzea cavernae]GHH39213.1 hypothetical protein GCM10017774_30500 [Lentzea cavernae]